MSSSLPTRWPRCTARPRRTRCVRCTCGYARAARWLSAPRRVRRRACSRPTITPSRRPRPSRAPPPSASPWCARAAPRLAVPHRPAPPARPALLTLRLAACTSAGWRLVRRQRSLLRRCRRVARGVTFQPRRPGHARGASVHVRAHAPPCRRRHADAARWGRTSRPTPHRSRRARRVASDRHAARRACSLAGVTTCVSRRSPWLGSLF
jgi:hypothetical protein